MIELLASGLGAAIVLALSISAVLVLVVWARGSPHGERPLILLVAIVFTCLACGLYALALSVGWWRGPYFQIPIQIQAAILITSSLVGWTVWLAGFRWLARNSTQAIATYIAVSLLIVLAVAIAHRLNLGNGQIMVGPDRTIVVDAVVVVLVLWVPVTIYEVLRRSVERVDLLP